MKLLWIGRKQAFNEDKFHRIFLSCIGSYEIVKFMKVSFLECSRYNVPNFHCQNYISTLLCDYFLSQCIGDLQNVIEYSRFDNDPGPHNFTIVAVSTTKQQVEYDYHFNVSGKHKNIIAWDFFPG